MINLHSKPKISEKIDKMRKEYKQNGIPTILNDSLNFLLLNVQIKNPKKILEIGTATGMSGISMLNVASPDAHLTTIEKDEQSFIEAKANFKECNLSHKVTQFCGDAGEIIKFLNGEFDFIFLDGAKARYLDYMPELLRLLSKKGVLFADNILFRGYVDGSVPYSHSDNTIVRNLRDFINEMTNNSNLTTQILNIGDGILLSIKD